MAATIAKELLANQQTDLVLSKNNALATVLHALATNTSLRKVSVASCLPNAVLYKVLQALKHRPNVRHVRLEKQHYIDNTGMLTDILTTTQTLTFLNLGYNCLGLSQHKHFGNFAQALKKNKTLQSLDLRENHLTDDHIIVIAEVLETNKTLKVMHLQKNNYHTPGMDALGVMLQTNQTLQELYVTHSCTIVFAKGLKHNHGLKTLQVMYSGYLGPALALNTSLLFLHLTWDFGLLEGIHIFNKYLAQNLTLAGITPRTFHLVNSPYTIDLGAAIAPNACRLFWQRQNHHQFPTACHVAFITMLLSGARFLTFLPLELWLEHIFPNFRYVDFPPDEVLCDQRKCWYCIHLLPDEDEEQQGYVINVNGEQFWNILLHYDV